MRAMQAGISLQNKNAKNLLFPYEETKRMKPIRNWEIIDSTSS